METKFRIFDDDIWRYDPWGGDCGVVFDAGILVVIRNGCSGRGSKTWKCKSVSDTQKLLNGEIVYLNWDNKGGTGIKAQMTGIRGDYITVWHGDKEYEFTRMTESGQEVGVLVGQAMAMNPARWFQQT